MIIYIKNSRTFTSRLLKLIGEVRVIRDKRIKLKYWERFYGPENNKLENTIRKRISFKILAKSIEITITKV